MSLAASSGYPFLDAMWTVFVFFGWVLFIWLLVLVYTDVFRRRDIGGWAKAGWVVFTLVLPFIGVFTYLIVEGRAMKDRQTRDVDEAQAELDEHIRSVAAGGDGAGSTADQIAQAKHLLDTGAISPDEYSQLKQKVLVG
ncbi:MAG TPA: hypothetical protein VKB75_05215 [Jatrophihabitans sp.]|nr:hypothetical protein [Jatrophihabitans sp.]